jgi:hypothetical protein
VTLRNRLRAIEKQTAAAARHTDHLAERLVCMDRDRATFLARVPADLRPRVAAALADPDPVVNERFSSWQLWPFARWAMPIPDGFVFPGVFVAWLLDPPRPWWMGRNCGRCGMGVPLFSTWGDDPDPPPSVVAFPACPACGGRTSYAAAFQPDPEGGEPCG